MLMILGYFGKIRHRGAAIKDNGEASGAVHIMRLEAGKP